MAFKTFLPALALVGYASAACSVSGTTTLASQADAGTISSCTTFTGSVAVATGATSGIDLGNLQAITGDLSAINAVGLPSLSGASLTNIGGAFTLTNMTLLTALTFPRLASVGSIAWTTLPRLSSLSFTTGVSKCDSVSITDTQLGSLDGINLKSVDQMIISNNGQLSDIDMQLTAVTSTFNVEFNGRTTTVALPNLQTAFNMTFRNVSSVTMPSLATINSSMGFYACTFQTFSAPNLTTIGGDLSFVSNAVLTNVSMPQLTAITGALQLANNTDLDNVNGFPDLANVGGAVDINGEFSNVVLPDLSNVAGAFNLQSTKDLTTTCSRFSNITGRDNVIKGDFTCIGSTSTPGGVGSSTSTSTSTQKGAAARDLFVRSSGVTGVLGVFAAIMGML